MQNSVERARTVALLDGLAAMLKEAEPGSWFLLPGVGSCMALDSNGEAMLGSLMANGVPCARDELNYVADSLQLSEAELAGFADKLDENPVLWSEPDKTAG